MTQSEAELHGRKYSKSFQKGFGLWVTDFEKMALKTVTKLGLSKYGILSVEMQRAVEADQSYMQNDGSPVYLDNGGEQGSIDGAAKKISLADKINEQRAAGVDLTPHAAPLETAKPIDLSEVKVATAVVQEPVNVTPVAPVVEEPKAPPPPPEKTPMQKMAGSMPCDALKGHAGVKVNEVPEDEMCEILNKIELDSETSKISDDVKLLYSNACVWLGRKQNLKNA